MKSGFATGFDTVAETAADWRALVGSQNPDPEVISAYLNGIYANVAAARAAFPHALLLTYDVNGSRPDADILDVEHFDATIAQCPGWWHDWHLHSHLLKKPCFYISASFIPALIAQMSAAGIARHEYLILSAHYGAGEHICGPGQRQCQYEQADGTQWDDKGAQGQNTDRLIYGNSFFPLPGDPEHYDWLDKTKRLIVGGNSENGLARRYDELRAMQTKTQHPRRRELTRIRLWLGILAGRVWTVSHTHRVHRKPSWGIEHRGFRYQALIRRKEGQKLA